MARKKKKCLIKNYRRISQRRMIDDDVGANNEKLEMERLQSILRESTVHVMLTQSPLQEKEEEGETKLKDGEIRSSANRTTLSSSSASSTVGSHQGSHQKQDDDDDEVERARKLLRESTDHLLVKASDLEDKNKRSDHSSLKKNLNDKDFITVRQVISESSQNVAKPPLLSDGLLESVDDVVRQPIDDHNALIVTRQRKKRKPVDASIRDIELTAEEIKAAKKTVKSASRKLKQLEHRAAQKAIRKELYSKLQQTSLRTSQLQLLNSSSSLGTNRTMKQQLAYLLQKERMGLPLSNEEQALLFRDRGEADDIHKHTCSSIMLLGSASSKHASTDSPLNENYNHELTLSKSNQKHRTCPHVDALIIAADPATSPVERSSQASGISGAMLDTTSNQESKDVLKSSDIAFQMMASLHRLKTTSASNGNRLSVKDDQDTALAGSLPGPLLKKQRYIPPEPTVLKTAAALGISKSDSHDDVLSRINFQLKRPGEIQATRSNLPVTGMEFEIMDAVKNNDVVIICSETGSGKSTQIPQFLYEAGMTESKLLIGITQPRRVAAVSTAKRVCYEMGAGNGYAIRSSSGGRGNLVAYQTRYETAGMGSDTRIKFMTDGLLLQEIQSDLLLRKYSVIVLDEAHERNLNTDVLVGLLSKAIALRKQACHEGLLSLKLIIMSATLRVEDFTAGRLFTEQPALVHVPGRNFPVTIHHSKVTEIDNYEDAAFVKVTKMHKKLPPGGILVFLTSKQEILRMVDRLRNALSRREASSMYKSTVNEIVFDGNNDSYSGRPRDLDDDELDGDLMFGKRAVADETDSPRMGNQDDLMLAEVNKRQLAYVLPLYSLLSNEDQAKVFDPPPDGHRLIVIATNVAETSITIPGISYVVDSGRQKCQNYQAATGIASYDIMWISKASADQRAGRAGRTGPGHCYRLYSSSMYLRHMDDFTMPEVLTRPLEDVVLAMKAMSIANVADFPFPTPPNNEQLLSALDLLANLGCIDVSNGGADSSDGVITRLGSAIAMLPLGVRYGKILLVAAQAGVLDYAVAMIAALSEDSPFLHRVKTSDSVCDVREDTLDKEKGLHKNLRESHDWSHRSGDALAVLIAVGAFTYASGDAGCTSAKLFCKVNNLNHSVMARVNRLRRHIARLSQIRLSGVDGIAAKTGNFLKFMSPPDKVQDQLLRQALVSGLLDKVAMLAPLAAFSGGGGGSSYSLRTAYICCSRDQREPLFLDRNSVLYSRDPRQLPPWICYVSLKRKTLKNGTPIALMKCATPVDPSWLGELAVKSNLLKIGEPLEVPRPMYNKERDEITCYVATKFGKSGWVLPPVKRSLDQTLNKFSTRNHSAYYEPGDQYRWFARFLLAGDVIAGFKGITEMLNDDPALITRKTASSKKAIMIVAALEGSDICSSRALRQHWSNVDDKFLFKYLKYWVNDAHVQQVQNIWISTVRKIVNDWKANNVVC